MDPYLGAPGALWEGPIWGISVPGMGKPLRKGSQEGPQEAHMGPNMARKYPYIQAYSNDLALFGGLKRASQEGPGRAYSEAPFEPLLEGLLAGPYCIAVG